MRHTDWLLTKSERANAQTRVDDRHPGEAAWSEGNLVRALIHGSTYFAELHRAIEAAGVGLTETEAARSGANHRARGVAVRVDHQDPVAGASRRG